MKVGPEMSFKHNLAKTELEEGKEKNLKEAIRGELYEEKSL